MTNLQAIDLLKGLEQSLDDYCELNDEGKTAFRMAITALEVFGIFEQLPSAQPDVPDTNVGDMISRQAAIDAANEWLLDCFKVQKQDRSCGLIRRLEDLPSAQPEITPDGTLTVSIDADIANVGRILLSQAGTQRGGLYYKGEQPEIIHCAECKWLQCNMRQDGTLPKGVDEFECRHWCGYCDPVDFCSHAERRTDG